jgi:adenylosuccinate synthase
VETTTVRVHKTTQERLKKLSSAEHVTIMELVDKLVDEHERFFWKCFDDEAKAFLDKEEIKARMMFEGASGDGIER